MNIFSLESLSWVLPNLSTTEWITHIVIFSINILLYLLARPIVSYINNSADSDSSENKIKIFKALNVLVFSLHILDLVILKVSSEYEGYFVNIGLSIITIYLGLLFSSIGAAFSRKRFGACKVVDDKKVYLDTYSTRIIDLLLLAAIAFTVIYSLINIWGANSLLEATGIFGIAAAFLAFTSSIWGPDVISGLIILNSQMLEDGDVVVVDGYKDEYIISKVSLIYVILYDIRNNHRTLIKNSLFIKSKIDNLSRVASSDGIRQKLAYKIGYPEFTGDDSEVRKTELRTFKSKVDKMFESAYEACLEKDAIKINKKRTFEWELTETGDFAIEYTLWFYLEKIPNTKVTKTIRKHLITTRYKVNEAVYDSSIQAGITLQTPTLHMVTLSSDIATGC